MPPDIPLIPAPAGIQTLDSDSQCWFPAFAGMSGWRWCTALPNTPMLDPRVRGDERRENTPPCRTLRRFQRHAIRNHAARHSAHSRVSVNADTGFGFRMRVPSFRGNERVETERGLATHSDARSPRARG